MSPSSPQSPTDEHYDVLSIAANNFMRLNVVRARFTENDRLVPVVGLNTEGKTSLLDLIAWGFRGPSAGIEKPVKDGAEQTWCEIDLGEFVIRRSQQSDSTKTNLVITRKGRSAPEKAPQSILDALYNKCSFDPVSFIREAPKSQAEILRRIMGVDTSGLDRDRADAYHSRTQVNAEVDRLDGVLKTLKIDEDVPDEPVSIAEMTEKHTAARKLIDVANSKTSALAMHDQKTEAAAQRIDDTTRRIQELTEQLKAARVKSEQLRQNHQELVNERPAFVQAISDALAACPDITGIEAAMSDMEAINQRIAENKRILNFQAERDIQKDKSVALTQKIHKIDAKKAELLATANIPIAGLTVEEDTVHFNAQPLLQASGAEKIRVGLAIGRALNPKLRLICVRDGSLIDAKGIRIVSEWAKQHEMLVLVERVAEGCQACEASGERTGEDGKQWQCDACGGSGYRKDVAGIVIDDGYATYGGDDGYGGNGESGGNGDKTNKNKEKKTTK